MIEVSYLSRVLGIHDITYILVSWYYERKCSVTYSPRPPLKNHTPVLKACLHCQGVCAHI